MQSFPVSISWKAEGVASGLRPRVRKAGVLVSNPDADSWLSPLPAAIRLAAMSKVSPSHTMSM